ncbi:FAD/NAD(P)-binding protein [Streptomyces sp. LE64]|uniref:FAD/NAD(P)-binding protein n=1 Tax=Streptomyces sp. LE64 TaxID=3448653 RepID=UPI004042B106
MTGQRPAPPHRTVAVVGAGAAGAMVAIQLCEEAVRRRRTPGAPDAFDVVLVDPAPEAGRGTAYATADPRHLLHLPADAMSCRPDDPGHFVRWLCRHGSPQGGAGEFVERYRYGAYLAEVLGRAVIAAHGTVGVRRLRTRATGCHWPGHSARLELAEGPPVDADCVVLATGPGPASAGWARTVLRGTDRLVLSPWSPGALDAALGAGRTDDVLLVGTGPVAVDLALRLERRGRTVHAVSPHGRLPRPRPEDRAAGRSDPPWDPHPYRLPPATARGLSRMRRLRRLRTHAGRLAGARGRPDGSLTVAVDLADGGGTRQLTVGWVVDCTDPEALRRDTADPLWRGLLDAGGAVPGPLGTGVSTDRGRLRDAEGRSVRPLWTLGAPRLGELPRSTAVPEIREQAAAVAEAVVGELTAPRGPSPRTSSRAGGAAGNVSDPLPEDQW